MKQKILIWILRYIQKYVYIEKFHESSEKYVYETFMTLLLGANAVHREMFDEMLLIQDNGAYLITSRDYEIFLTILQDSMLVSRDNADFLTQQIYPMNVHYFQFLLQESYKAWKDFGYIGIYWIYQKKVPINLQESLKLHWKQKQIGLKQSRDQYPRQY